MKRQVECQQKEERVVTARGSTPDDGSLAPDIEKTEVMVLFYDAGEIEYHRNSYTILLSKKEAAKYKVGEIYTLTID